MKFKCEQGWSREGLQTSFFNKVCTHFLNTQCLRTRECHPWSIIHDLSSIFPIKIIKIIKIIKFITCSDSYCHLFIQFLTNEITLNWYWYYCRIHCSTLFSNFWRIRRRCSGQTGFSIWLIQVKNSLLFISFITFAFLRIF